MTHLFTYGTLMFPEVWRLVVDREFARSSARVTGFNVFLVHGDLYPVMVRSDAAATVSGIVYRDLDESAINLLDAYESDIYDHIPVDAELETGEQLTCEAYVLAERHRELQSTEPWTAEWFEREAMPEYLKRLVR